MNNQIEFVSASEHLSTKKIACFGAALATIFVGHAFYQDALFEASHNVIVSLQKDRSEASYKFFNWLSDATNEDIYSKIPLLLLPFLSR